MHVHVTYNIALHQSLESFFLFFTNSLVQKKSNAEEIYKNISLKKKIKLCSKLVEHHNFDHIFSEPLEV